LVFTGAPRLKSAAAILSLFFFVIDCYGFSRPVDFEMTNESFYVIVPGEGATGPKKFQHLRNGVRCQLMNLNVVGCQDVSKFLRDWQTKPRSEKKSRNTTLSFFLGFGVVSFPGKRQIPGSKQPSSHRASRSA
jgi:hypothetical protein